MILSIKNTLLCILLLNIMLGCQKEETIIQTPSTIEPEIIIKEPEPNKMLKMSDRAKNATQDSAYFNKLLLGYYGRPKTKTMGILGMHEPEELVIKLKEHTKIYQEAIEQDITVKPVFHLIYGMATMEPQKNGSYLSFLSNETVMQYINLAEKEDLLVILDVQIGNRIPVDAIQKALPFLKYKNVHLAIDPEFAVTHLTDTRPGKFIGYITAQQLNDVQQAMLDYMLANNIEDNKILIVHSFKPRMIRNQSEIKTFDKIDLTINADGYSNPNVKIDVFDLVITQEINNKAFVGFKLFLDPKKDTPIMTPKQSLGLASYKNVSKLRIMPSYINMQ